MSASCLVLDCPLEGSTRHGFCRDHQNRLNAFLKELMNHPSITTEDRIAIAAHPGWRGRPFGLYPVQTGDDTVRFSVFNVKSYRLMRAQAFSVYDRAVDALAELDRRNGVAPAADVARLKDDLDVERRDNRDMWCALDTIQGITYGIFPPPATSTDEITVGSVAVEKVAALKRRLDEVDADAKKLTAERRSAMRTLNDIRAIARGLLPAPPPPSTSPATLEESALATVASLVRDRDLAVKLAEAIRSELAAAREALDKQATTVARLTSELAERERDITYACADRDEYLKERDEARAELAFARRPWWAKLWAWVSGGGGK